MRTHITGVNDNLRLARALAEELKLPLIQIARKGELARMTADPNQVRDIELTADGALRLIESYLFSTRVLLTQQQLDLEPISVGSTMYDIAQYLSGHARMYNCDLDIDVKSSIGLAMAHPEALKSVLTSLAFTLISTPNDRLSRKKVVLSAARVDNVIRAQVISVDHIIAKDSLAQARNLSGVARKTSKDISHNTGAGVLLADRLMKAMNSDLKITRMGSSSGLGGDLLISKQLSLI
ncbi:MAG: hypothetical protein M3P98_03720 [bacterium]|nr:hypothetical protein [bacterium]